MRRQRNNTVLRQWEDVPEFMKNEKVKEYYDILNKRRFQLKVKRIFDVIMSFVLILLLSPVFLGIAIWIRLDSSGPVFYKQERITQYGRKFQIFKFRTMVDNADQRGTLITLRNDTRITKAGEKIRKLRIDEIKISLDLVNQCTDWLLSHQEGKVALELNQINIKPKAGKAVSYTESVRGLVMCHLITDGSEKPKRVKWRTPSFYAVQVLEKLAIGNTIADLMAIYGSLDIVLPEADR